MKKLVVCGLCFFGVFTVSVFANDRLQLAFRPATVQETGSSEGGRLNRNTETGQTQRGNTISVYTKPADSLIDLYTRIVSGDHRGELDDIDSAAFFRHNPASRIAMIRAFSQGSGSVEVRANVERGLLIVNDSLEYPGTNFPVTLTNMPVGAHTIRVRSDLGIVDMARVNVTNAQKRIANIEIATPKSSLQVKSDPTASFVYIEGKRVGHTPIEVEGLDAGVYSLEVKRAGFTPFETRVEIEMGKASQIFVPLVPTVPEKIDAPIYAQPKYIVGASFATAGLVFGILSVVNRVSYHRHFADGEDYARRFNEAFEASRPQVLLDELYENELSSKARAEFSRDRSNIFFMLTFISASFSVPILVF